MSFSFQALLDYISVSFYYPLILRHTLFRYFRLMVFLSHLKSYLFCGVLSRVCPTQPCRQPTTHVFNLFHLVPRLAALFHKLTAAFYLYFFGSCKHRPFVPLCFNCCSFARPVRSNSPYPKLLRLSPLSATCTTLSSQCISSLVGKIHATRYCQRAAVDVFDGYPLPLTSPTWRKKKPFHFSHHGHARIQLDWMP